jgi:hypothetical protein
MSLYVNTIFKLTCEFRFSFNNVASGCLVVSGFKQVLWTFSSCSRPSVLMAADAAAGALLTLDVVEQQCLVAHLEGENDLYWRHRLILEPTPVPGIWMVATPDFEVERLDLGAYRVIPLSRNTPFPYVPFLDPFDTPIAAVTLSALHQRAREILARAIILGVVAHRDHVRASAITWRVASTSSALFAFVVPVAVVANPARFVQPAVAGAEFYPVALALFADCWLFCEGVTDEQYVVWREAKVIARVLTIRVDPHAPL